MTHAISSGLLCLLLLISSVTLAANPLVLEKHMTGQQIVEALEVLHDGPDTLSLTEILAYQDLFIKVQDKYHLPSPKGKPLWMRVKVHNPSPSDHQWHLVHHSYVPYIAFFSVDQQNTITPLGIIDENQAFSHRPVEYRRPAAVITTPGHTEQWIYFAMQANFPLNAAVISQVFAVWSAKDFAIYVARENAGFGLLIGGMALIGLYNFLLLLSVRDSVYFYYVIYIAFTCLSWLIITSLIAQYFFHDANSNFMRMYAICAYGALMSVLRFTQILLNLHRYLPLFHRLFYGLIGLFGLGLIWAIFADDPELAGMYAASGFIVFFLLPLVGAWVWWRGFRPARFYVLAWFIPSVMATLTVLAFWNTVAFGIMPLDIRWLDILLVSAYTLESVLLSFALGDRINAMRREKLQIQADLVATQQHMNEELETQVAYRTGELQEANKALLKLSTEDELTQLFNRRYFDKKLDQEWQRSQRKALSLSLIMCDIDYFKKFNDNYGHQAGDRCLQKVAQAIRNNIKRSYDVATRYGGEEFAIILPQTESKHAYHIAESIRQEIENLAILHSQSACSEFISMSFGVASITPKQDKDKSVLVAQADQALYNSKTSGRNRVSIYEPTG
ncbi:MAG: diguanylate cyclase [Pseudomonadota bacterium]